jgi:hypothetical protein
MLMHHHLIQTSQIIGIGPLQVQALTEGIELHYNSRRYLYDVHLLHRTVTIKSDVFRPDASDKNEQKEKVRMEIAAWKDEYDRIRQEVEEHIKEPVPIKAQDSI